MNIGCLNNDKNDNNSNKFSEYADYSIEINTNGSYYLKVPFLSLRDNEIDKLVKKMEILEGNLKYSIDKINNSDIPYFNVTQLMNEFNKKHEDFPKFQDNDISLVLQGVGITKLNLKIDGKYMGDLTLKNDINSSYYWVFSSNNNQSIWFHIKATIITKNSEDYWNDEGLNFLLQNGWQIIKIKHFGLMQ